MGAYRGGIWFRRYIRRELLLPTWKVVLAIVACLDILSCWPQIVRGWSPPDEPPPETPLWRAPWRGHEQCPAHDEEMSSSSAGTWVWVGPLFCFLCLIDALLRAKEAQQEAYENAALDVFEEKLSGLSYATRRSFLPSPQDQFDREMARKTLRIWGPVATTLSLWFVLLPWTSWTAKCGSHDPALLSVWLGHMTTHVNSKWQALVQQAYSLVWKEAIHRAIRRPRRFYKRVRKVLEWIRFIRFAGPLIRMIDKVQHRLRDLWQTWRQARIARENKLTRVARRSLLLEDIRRVASLERFQSALRSVRSQYFRLLSPNHQDLLKTKVGDSLASEKVVREHLRRQVDSLTVHANQSSSNLFDVYDHFVDLTQEISATVQKNVWSSYLISPNTWFCVGWRVIVSVALILELARLSASWRVSGGFTVSLAEILNGLFVTCDGGSRRKGRFHFFARLFPWSRGNKASRDAACLAASSSNAALSLYIGGIIEQAIDLVCFLDIFVWYYTGELDNSGIVVPKPFFTRCILPGTLVQVFDHPTLPIPMLMVQVMWVFESVGYARAIRWVLVLIPVLEMLVVDPAKGILLRPASVGELAYKHHYRGSLVY